MRLVGRIIQIHKAASRVDLFLLCLLLQHNLASYCGCNLHTPGSSRYCCKEHSAADTTEEACQVLLPSTPLGPRTMSEVTPTEFLPFEDKDFDLLAEPQDYPLDSFFHQFFNHDQSSLDSSENSNGSSNLFEDLDMGVLSSNDPFIDHTASNTPAAQYQPLHSWRANSWREHKVTPVPQNQKLVHRLRPEGVAITGSELLELEGKDRTYTHRGTNLSSPPTTPANKPLRKKRASRPATFSASQRVHKSSKASARGGVVSPKMMQSSYYARQESPFYDWTERFQQFNLQIPSNQLPISPPPSAKVLQQEPSVNFMQGPGDTEPISPVSPTSFVRRASKVRRHSRMATSHVFQPTIHEQRRQSVMWMQNPDADFTISPTQIHPSWTPNIQQSTSLYPDFEPLTEPQEFSQLPPDFSQGLMINCGPFDELPRTATATNFFPTAQGTFQTSSTTVDEDDYVSDVSPGTSIIHRYAGTPRSQRSLSPSPPSSPSPSSRPRRRSKPNRRKYSSGNTPKTPKTPNGASMGFVNFTPEDSKKILTGVAPSGSSKTKARREREANDKRRKLSEAAAKAIRELGGDVERLKKELLN